MPLDSPAETPLDQQFSYPPPGGLRDQRTALRAKKRTQSHGFATCRQGPWSFKGWSVPSSIALAILLTGIHRKQAGFCMPSTPRPNLPRSSHLYSFRTIQLQSSPREDWQEDWTLCSCSLIPPTTTAPAVQYPCEVESCNQITICDLPSPYTSRLSPHTSFRCSMCIPPPTCCSPDSGSPARSTNPS